MGKYLSLVSVVLVLGCPEAAVDPPAVDAGPLLDAGLARDLQVSDGSSSDQGSPVDLGQAGPLDGDLPADQGVGLDSTPGSDATGQPSQDGAMSAEDSAEVVSATLPQALDCGERFAAEVTVRNTGRATWSRATGFKLGAVDDSDPFYDRDTRVWLSPDDSVEPGQVHTFAFEMTAPADEGVYTTDWRMVHEGVNWFGEVVSQEVTVTCNMNPAERAPLPDERGVVNQLAAERPDLLAQSCVRDGGNNEFLFELVRRLRARDRRWGLNWKRGVVGDMSQDVVDYYFGPGEPQEGSTDVYIIDVIGGHCPEEGDGPSWPAWGDQTQATADAGTIGRWTLRPLRP